MYTYFRQAARGGLIAATVTAIGCAESTPLDLAFDPGSMGPRYELVAGDRQTARAGTELPEPLVVRVTTATGTPVAGQLVNWVITEGGGSVFAGRALTDSLGVAREWWTLGETPGANALEVRAVDSSTGEPLVFGRFEATGTDSTVAEPAPPPSTISISATAYKVKGLQKVDLAWSGADGASVEIYRDDVLLARTANDGEHHDPIDGRGSGSYRYRVCEEGATVCSAEARVTF